MPKNAQAQLHSSHKLVSWRNQWHPTPVLLPGKSHGRRSLVGCSPRGCWGSDTTERLHFHCSLSCIGEGNGNPLQYSCLENPGDGGAWWAAIYGVAQSRTRLKRLSSSSSSSSRSSLTQLVGHQSFYLPNVPSIYFVLDVAVHWVTETHRHYSQDAVKLLDKAF